MYFSYFNSFVAIYDWSLELYLNAYLTIKVVQGKGIYIYQIASLCVLRLAINRPTIAKLLDSCSTIVVEILSYVYTIYYQCQQNAIKDC